VLNKNNKQYSKTINIELPSVKPLSYAFSAQLPPWVSGWSVIVAFPTRGAWSCSTTTPGALCVMMILMLKTPVLCVTCWGSPGELERVDRVGFSS